MISSTSAMRRKVKLPTILSASWSVHFTMPDMMRKMRYNDAMLLSVACP